MNERTKTTPLEPFPFKYLPSTCTVRPFVRSVYIENQWKNLVNIFFAPTKVMNKFCTTHKILCGLEDKGHFILAGKNTTSFNLLVSPST